MSRQFTTDHAIRPLMTDFPYPDKALITRLSATVPRYTSYPTAPHFSSDVDGQAYACWLSEIPSNSAVSLYVHIPYCDRLCWFCACATKQTHRYAPLKRYLKSLFQEIDLVSKRISRDCIVTALHFGGGSPTMLRPEDIIATVNHLKQAFSFCANAEISIEIDPNDMDEPRHRALSAIGMTRASLGVQDFDERVQKAINRDQTFEKTRTVIDAARSGGARSVNIDLLYGLPHQSTSSVESTLRQVLTLSPDRIALFGYAHVPWMKKHQTMIDEAALPGTIARYEQSQHAASQLLEAGYHPVGIDHFAKPGDALASAAQKKGLRRNFQGYTTDTADVIIGLGASAIGKLPRGYVQNMPSAGGYERMIGEGQLATVRGFELAEMDKVRAWVIERLMCDFGFSADKIRNSFGAVADTICREAGQVAARDTDGLFQQTASGFRITDKGKPFARLIASQFDSYVGGGGARHSAAV